MITGAIKNKVDKIWTDIWAGGIANLLTVIKQLKYLYLLNNRKSLAAQGKAARLW